MAKPKKSLPRYRDSVAGTLLAAREAVMNPIRPYLRQVGLTEQQWRVLRVLSDEGALDSTRLASAALLGPPTVTRIVRELMDRGLIERHPDDKDGRRSLIALRHEGAALVNLTGLHTVALTELLREKFGAERLDKLRDELVALTKVFDT
ncbi:MAG: MarR family transcriptional regulator [Sphingobium limneticum]